MTNKLTKIALSAAIPLLITMLSGCSSGENNKPSEQSTANSTQAANTTAGTVNNISDSTVIDLKEYIDIEFDGYSGSGNAKVSVNYEAMALLLSNDGKDTFGAYATINDIQASSVENNGKLSNGDKITIKVSYNETTLENANVELKNTEIEYEVSGLEEKELLDIFKDVEIIVTEIYIAGETDTYNVNVKYNGDVNDKYYGKFKSFNITDKDGNRPTYYKEGDTIIVSISDVAVENFTKVYPQYAFLETSREYTVTYNAD